MTTPNVYHLHGPHLSVTYATTGIDGKPSFHYQDAQQTRVFTGDQIRTVDLEIGTLVTVTIHLTVDTGSTSFTLLVPRVNLSSPTQVVNITAEGITTLHRFSVIQQFNLGQTELYTFTRLTGTAQAVVF